MLGDGGKQRLSDERVGGVLQGVPILKITGATPSVITWVQVDFILGVFFYIRGQYGHPSKSPLTPPIAMDISRITFTLCDFWLQFAVIN